MSCYAALKMMVFKKKVVTFYLDGKCVNLNKELRSRSFNDGFKRFRLFSTISVAYPCHIKLDIWRFLQVLAGRMQPAGCSFPTPGLIDLFTSSHVLV